MTLPDRLAIYHTAEAGDSPEDEVLQVAEARARFHTLDSSEALTANAEGKYDARVTHTAVVEYRSEYLYNAKVRRHRDNAVFLVLGATPSDRVFGDGTPMSLTLSLSLLNPRPEVPDVQLAP
jgi:hypothetical protein